MRSHGTWVRLSHVLGIDHTVQRYLLAPEPRKSTLPRCHTTPPALIACVLAPFRLCEAAREVWAWLHLGCINRTSLLQAIAVALVDGAARWLLGRCSPIGLHACCCCCCCSSGGGGCCCCDPRCPDGGECTVLAPASPRGGNEEAGAVGAEAPFTTSEDRWGRASPYEAAASACTAAPSSAGGKA